MATRETTVRRRTRLARGPLTIGDPAPAIETVLPAGELYRPDTVADGGSAIGLTVRAASVRGLSKRYGGAPRQDDLCLRVHAPTRTLIAAVADGVSAAPRADMAAALAVRQAAAAVARQLDDGAVEIAWREVFEHAAWALVEEHRRERADPGAGADDAAASLATTLIVAAITVPAPGDPGRSPPGQGQDGERPSAISVQLAAVGDSPAYVLTRRGFTLLVGEGDHEDGLLGGGVRALPLGVRSVRTVTCNLEPADVLLICTDGLALPLDDGRGEVGRTFARELARPPDIVDFARLLDFSRNTYDDDRTLVAVWPRAQP